MTLMKIILDWRDGLRTTDLCSNIARTLQCVLTSCLHWFYHLRQIL